MHCPACLPVMSLICCKWPHSHRTALLFDPRAPLAFQLHAQSALSRTLHALPYFLTFCSQDHVLPSEDIHWPVE